MQVVYTNSRISLTNDLVFGLSVLTETGWVPYSELDENDRDIVRRAVDYDRACPFLDQILQS